MQLLDLLLIMIGGLFSLFGYLIYFRECYGLINHFRQDKEAGRRDDAYAQRIGLIEMIGGVTCMIQGAAAFWANRDWLSGLIIAVCLGGILLALLINSVKSKPE